MQKKRLLMKLSSKKVYFVLTAVTSLLIFSTFVFSSYYFRVKHIYLSGEKGSNFKGAELFEGKNLLLTTAQMITNTVYENNPEIKTLKIEKKFPDSLYLQLSYRNPITYIDVDRGLFQIDEDGKILMKIKKRPVNYPVINYYQKLNYDSYEIGDYLSYKDIKTALFFLVKLSDLGFTVESIDINGLSMLVFKLKDNKIVFSVEKDHSIQEYQLAVILKQFKIEGKKFKSIDLRFEKPIIEY